MTTTPSPAETEIEVRERELDGRPARSAVFRRTYAADVADVWDACTDPERLSRWYAPVTGELRLGGVIDQGDFGPGRITRCQPPEVLTVALGGGDPASDEIELRLTSAGERTVLEFEHTTTLDSHTIGGQVFDAVYCMGGGYGPRLITLAQHLAGVLDPATDATALHLVPDYREAIERSMSVIADQLAELPSAAPSERTHP